jgi:hypothetical protein
MSWLRQSEASQLVLPMRSAERSRTDNHWPAPRQKLPEISPIFKTDTVRLHVSREKDGKLRLGYAGMGRYEGRSAGRLRASSQGWNAGSEPPGRGSDDPPLQKLGPPSGPPGFFQLRVPLTCIEPCIFCTRF